jgi:hypothetical protein
MKIGKKIYYDKLTGNVITSTSEMQGDVVPTSMEYDMMLFKELSERNPQTVGLLELSYGAYSQDFKESIGYSVDVVTGLIKFMYPDPNLPPEVMPKPQKPLTEKVEELEATFMYDSMMKDMAIEQTNNGQAELMYTLMMNGVI